MEGSCPGRVWGGLSCQTGADSRERAEFTWQRLSPQGWLLGLGEPQGGEGVVPQQPQNQQHGGEEEPSKAWRGVFHVQV